MRDAEAERLLRRLLQGPLDLDGVLRFCLRDTEVVPYMFRAERSLDEMHRMSGLLDTLATLGKAPSLQDVLRESEARIEQARLRLDLDRLDPALRQRCQRRAEFLLGYLQENGWVERAGDLWSLTPSGREFLRQGGFYAGA